MENLDVLVLRTLRDWRAAGRRALLATVVRTWGSSPRPVGSIMALAEDGSVVGSVSGGCIEDDLIYRHTQAYAGKEGAKGIPSGPPTLVKYGITADEAHRFGLPCGGTLELLLEYDPDAASLAQLVGCSRPGQLMRRSVRLADGAVTLEPADTPSELVVDAERAGQHLRPRVPHAADRRRPAHRVPGDHGAVQRLRGDGVRSARGIPRRLQRAGRQTGDRHARRRGPRLQARSPQLRGGPHARPEAGRPGLAGGVETEAFYVGAIGSRRNNEARRERMVEHFEQTEASLQRLRGPIGIYIGSKTPPEIAVSVMAEILAVKNGVVLPGMNAAAGGAPLSSAVAILASRVCDHSHATLGRAGVESSDGQCTTLVRTSCAPTNQTMTCARQCGDGMSNTERSHRSTEDSGRYFRQKNIEPLKSPLASHQTQTLFGLLSDWHRIFPITMSEPFQQLPSIMQRPKVKSTSSRNPLYGARWMPLG
jgi:xanthine dehydrogenase accessory factor